MKTNCKRICILSIFGFWCIFSCRVSDNEKSIQYETISDIEGNSYKTVIIGNQVWMAENLRTTKYNDGSNIPINKKDATSSYYWYDNDIKYKVPYGALYNWYTVKTGKLCPTGWHIPSDSEWSSLNLFLGGAKEAAKKLKEVGLTHWIGPINEATDEYGFTGLPGGKLYYDGQFNALKYEGMGKFGEWWSSTEISTIFAVRWTLSYYYVNNTFEGGPILKEWGYSIRCIKN